MMTSIFSAGNTYTYAAVRSLYGLSLEGRAPAFLRHCTAKGVPIWCFCVVMVFPFLSFLQVSKSSADVLLWLVAVITAGGMYLVLYSPPLQVTDMLTLGLINYIVMSITYIQFYNACKAQGLDRRTLVRLGFDSRVCSR